jgi:hypothetical protein
MQTFIIELSYNYILIMKILKTLSVTLVFALALVLVNGAAAQTVNSTATTTVNTSAVTTDTTATEAPGLPNTGVGGDAMANMGVLLASSLVALGAIALLARRVSQA